MRFFLRLFALSVLLSGFARVNAQTTIFSENVGTPSGTTAIASYTGWQNFGTLTFTGTADVRNTTVSTGYTGASGGGNVFITNTVGTNFQIASINTTSYTSLSLSFGILKNTTASNGSDLIVEVSSDGTSYTPLTVPALPTGTGTAVWALRTATGTIPSTANLRIRFRQNGTATQYRIDDVKLVGTPVGGTPVVNLSVSSNTGSEAATSVITVTATASSAVTGDQTVTVTPSGTGITAGDYSLSNTTITILSGNTTGSVTFTIVDDAAIEGTETATLTISSPSAGLVLGSTTTQNVSITDNDFNFVSLSANAATGTETATTVVTLTATTTQAVASNQTVNVAITGTSITATDYTLSNTVITINSGSSTGSVTFTIADDNMRESLETAIATISSPSAGITLGTPTSVNIDITDNDDAISLATLNTPTAVITFDELVNTGSGITGTTNMPRGAYFYEETGSGINTTYRADNGTGNAGDTYSFGATGSTDRAFGSIGSNGIVLTHNGLKLVNNTGGSINTLDVEYYGEQWRNGAATADGYRFQVSTDATSLSTGTWTTVSALNYSTSTTSPIDGALNGNLAGNRTLVTGSAFFSAVANGGTVWVRWSDDNNAGNDDGIGVDDAKFTPKSISVNTFYSQATGDLDQLTTWGNVTDGTGIAPTSFTAAGQTFILANRATSVLTNNWTVSGLGSKVVVPTDVTFVIPDSAVLTGILDVDSNATAQLENSVAPTFGLIDLDSYVIYAGATALVQNVVSNTTYGNLVFTNGGTRNVIGDFRVANQFDIQDGILDGNTSSFWVAFFQRDLNIANTVTYNNGFYTNVNFQAYGPFHQVIDGNGGTIQADRLMMNVSNGGSLITSGIDFKTDTLELAAGTVLKLKDDLKLNTTATSYFIDNGDTIKVGGDVEAAGITANYNFTGTIELINNFNGGTSNIRQDGAAGSGVSIKAVLNNILVNTSSNVTTKFMPTATPITLTINGDLVIDGTSTGLVELGANVYNLGGDFIDNRTTDVIGEGTSTIVFNGSAAQQFVSTNPSGDALNKVTLNNTNGVQQAGVMTVNNALAITSGVWNTNPDKIILGSTATITENDTAYVLGLVETTRTLAQNVNNTFGGLGLEINAIGAAPGSTLVTRTTGISLPLGCFVSVKRQFEVTPTVNTGLNATIKYTYLETPELNGLDEPFLRIFESIGAAPYTALTASVPVASTNSISITGRNVVGKYTAANPTPSAGSAFASGGSASNPDRVICSGTTTTLTMTGSLGFIQWQQSPNGNTLWTDIAGATNATYTTPALTTTTYYRSIVTNPCYSIASNTVKVSISATPVVTITNVTATTAQVSWTPFAPGQYNLAWSGAAGSGTANAVTTIPFTIASLTAGQTLNVTVTKTAPVCAGTSPGTATTTTLCAKPIITSVTPVVSPSNAKGLKVIWTGSAAAYRVYYRPLTMNANWSAVDTTGTFKTIIPLYAGVSYALKVQAKDCPVAGQLGQESDVYYFGTTTGPVSVCGPVPTVTAVSNCPNQITVNLGGGTGTWRVTARRLSPSYTGGVSYTVSSPVVSLAITATSTGSIWEVFAQSVCGSTYSGISTVSVVTVKAPCPAPQNLVLSNVVCNGFTASWNNLNCSGNPLSGYYIYLRKQGASFFSAYPVGTNNIKLVNWLAGGFYYDVYLGAATCNGSLSAVTPIQTVTLPACRDEFSENVEPMEEANFDANGTALQVYPNPSSGLFYATVYGALQGSSVDVVVMDALGRSVYQSIVTEAKNIEHVSIVMPNDAAAGLYLLRATVNGKTYTTRVSYTK